MYSKKFTPMYIGVNFYISSTSFIRHFNLFLGASFFHSSPDSSSNFSSFGFFFSSSSKISSTFKKHFPLMRVYFLSRLPNFFFLKNVFRFYLKEAPGGALDWFDRFLLRSITRRGHRMLRPLESKTSVSQK